MLCNDVMIDGVNVTVDSGAPLKQLHLTPCPYGKQTMKKQFLATGGTEKLTGMYPQIIVIIQL